MKPSKSIETFNALNVLSVLNVLVCKPNMTCFYKKRNTGLKWVQMIFCLVCRRHHNDNAEKKSYWKCFAFSGSDILESLDHLFHNLLGNWYVSSSLLNQILVTQKAITPKKWNNDLQCEVFFLSRRLYSKFTKKYSRTI